MRLLRILVTSLTLAVFPFALVTGCAGSPNGALPASPAWASLASPHAPAQYLQSAKKMAIGCSLAGKLVWTSTIASNLVGNGGAQATPVIVNGTIYAGCYTVCAFDVPKNGDRSR